MELQLSHVIQDKLQIMYGPMPLGHLGTEHYTQQCKDGSSFDGHPKEHEHNCKNQALQWRSCY